MPAAMGGAEEIVVSETTTSDLFTHTFYYSATESDATRNYTVCYDTKARTPYWVAYPLNSSYLGSVGRTEDWAYVDSSLIPTTCQPDVKSGSFSNASGTNNYSKGHLLPSASRTKTEAMNKQTFLAVNIAPQIQTSFNGGIWSSLEGALQTMAKTSDLYIVTGTMCPSVGDDFNTQNTYDANGLQIPAPRYFYKVVLKYKNGSASAIGFWFTNEGHSGNYYDSAYVRSVDQIEALTGLDFFVNLPDSVENTAESNASWSSFQSF